MFLGQSFIFYFIDFSVIFRTLNKSSVFTMNLRYRVLTETSINPHLSTVFGVIEVSFPLPSSLPTKLQEKLVYLIRPPR